MLSNAKGSEMLDLRVADSGRRPAALPGHAATRRRRRSLRMVGTLIGLEVERSRGPERASEAAVASFLADVLDRKVTDRENIVARAQRARLRPGRRRRVVVAAPTRSSPRRATGARAC